MQESKKEDMSQTSIIAEQNEELCLDTIQLKRLEESYREWVESSPRSNVYFSRKRILLIFLLIRYTGAKLNEILSIDPLQDIDFKQKRVVLKGRKGKSGTGLRKIPVPESLFDEIRAVISAPDFLKSIHTIFSIDPGFVRRKFYERSESCGFDKKLGSPELIRKARGAELLQSNMPLPAVQSLLGHSTPNLTTSMVSFSEKEMQRLTQAFIERESNRRTSARNSFFGKLSVIEKGDVQARIQMATIDGLTVTATITNSSLVQLGLTLGRLVTAEVKAPWIILQGMENESPLCTAENLFKGTVSRVTSGNVITEYAVRISDVTELCSIVTTESCRQAGLQVGDRVWAMFNSFSVVLHA